MENVVLRKTTHKVFLITILFNAINGLGDLGAALVFILQKKVLWLLLLGFDHPGDLGEFVRGAYNALGTLSPYSHTLAIAYFVSHGSIKLFLSWALWRKKIWAYPVALFFFGVFSLYQGVVLFWHHTTLDIVLLGINLLVLIMVSNEYRIIRKLVGKELAN